MLNESLYQLMNLKGDCLLQLYILVSNSAADFVRNKFKEILICVFFFLRFPPR